MRNLILIIVLSLFTESVILCQKYKNMSLASRYDDDQLPQQSGVAYSDVWGYAYPDGKEIAIIGTLDSIWIYEVTDPFNIRRVFSFSGGFRTIWREFKTYQNYLFAITDAANEGLTIFDLKNAPDSIVLAHRDQAHVLTSHMLFVDTATSHLYIAGGRDSSGPVDLIMMDLQFDPTHPRLIKKIDLPGNYVHDLFVRNDTAFCSHGFNGFYIYKIEQNGDYTELSSINIYQQQGYNHSSWLHENGKYLIWADETHNTSLKMVDVSDRQNPRIVKLFRSALEAPLDTASMAHNPYFKGEYAFVSYYHDGVVVFNCSDPLNPEIIAYYDTEPSNQDYSQQYAGAWGVYPYLPSGSILASDIQNGLFVLYLDFQLSLCEPEFQVQKISDQAEINWKLPESFCYSELSLQRAYNHSGFKEIYIPPNFPSQGRFTDAIKAPGDYYYKMKWRINDEIHESSIKNIHQNADCFDYQIANNILSSQCGETFIKKLNILNAEGKYIAALNDIQLPYSLVFHNLQGIYFLEIIDKLNKTKTIRYPN